MCCRQEPEPDRSREDASGAACEQDLPELPDACVTPETSIHPGAVEDTETKRSREENVRQDYPQVLGEPAEILEANSESDNRRYNQRRGV